MIGKLNSNERCISTHHTHRPRWRRAALSLAFGLLVAGQSPAVWAVTKTEINRSANQVNALEGKIQQQNARLRTLQKTLTLQEQQIQKTRDQLRSQRLANQKELLDAERGVKLQRIEIDRIERDLALVKSDLEIIERDKARDQQRFDDLNLFKKQLEEDDFRARQTDYNREAKGLEARRQQLREELVAASAKLAELEEQVTALGGDSSDATLDKTPQMAQLIQLRDNTRQDVANISSNLSKLRSEFSQSKRQFAQLMDTYKQEQEQQQSQASRNQRSSKPAPASNMVADPTSPTYPAYVFAISGSQQPDIESTLKLRDWVEALGAKYIEASWNGITNPSGNDSSNFKRQFAQLLNQIPRNSRILLIGHGRGGATAIEAATEVARGAKRKIDFLAALDPMAADGLRANIVYTPQQACEQPSERDAARNQAYIACIQQAKRRVITDNVRFFYNRWQKDAAGPFDYQRQLNTAGSGKGGSEVPTATGRFVLSDGIRSDQRRLFYANDVNAHQQLLQDEARELPMLIREHLR